MHTWQDMSRVNSLYTCIWCTGGGEGWGDLFPSLLLFSPVVYSFKSEEQKQNKQPTLTTQFCFSITL